MTDTRTPRPDPDTQATEIAGPNDRTPTPLPKDAESAKSKPQGTLTDQVATMESEGQAQPQAGDRTAEELEDEARSQPPT